MGEKSANKKKFILETAREIFAAKGYIATTMRDVVEKCDISRGGVYLYFDNIRDLFEELMASEFDSESNLEKSIPDDATYKDVLMLFIKAKKKVILSKKSDLTVAIYEYYFQNKVSDKDNRLKEEFNTDLYVLEKIISNGIDAAEFYDIDAHRAASNLMYLLEGIKVSSRTMGITEKAIDEEIDYVLQGIIAED